MESAESFVNEEKKITPLKEGIFTEGTRKLENATIHFYEFGEGVKLCLIPPWPMSALTFLPMGETLMKLGFSVTAIDIPGWMGFSELKTVNFSYTFEEYASMIQEFIEKHYPNEEKIILAGYSMGGLFALYLMNRLGNKIDTVVAMSTPYEGISIGSTRPVLKKAVATADRFPRLGELLKLGFRYLRLEKMRDLAPSWYVKKLEKAYQNLDTKGVIRFTKQFLKMDLTEILKKLNEKLEQRKPDTPNVVWITGDDDSLVLAEKVAKITREIIPEAFFFKIEGMDHNGLVTHPKTLARYLGMALTRIDESK